MIHSQKIILGFALVLIAALAAYGIGHAAANYAFDTFSKKRIQYVKGSIVSVDTQGGSFVIAPWHGLRPIRLYTTDDLTILKRRILTKDNVIIGAEDTPQKFLESVIPGEQAYAIFWMNTATERLTTDYLVVGDSFPGF